MNLKRYFNASLVLFLLLFLVPSWDIFANFRIFGYSFRLFYVLELILFVLLLYKRKKIAVFPGHIIFVFWIFFILIAIPNTTILVRNIGYFIWLIFSYFLIILIINYFQADKKFFIGIKLYIFTYIAMAFFGFLQFLLGLKGISLMTTQWWIKGVLPRINGLSYEPSYYGTYMAGGAVLLYWLTFVEKIKILRYQIVFTYFLILIVILSSSRIGILSLFFLVFFHIFYKFFVPLLKAKLNKNGLKITVFSLTLITFAILFVLTHLNTFKLFLSGVGLFGTSSHSVSQRWQETMDTFRVFLQNPIIGVSLGGIPSHRAKLYGITISSQLEAKQFEGMNVILEVLAASGIFGFLFFLLFWINIFKVHYSLKLKSKYFAKSNFSNKNLKFLFSITNAFLVMILIEIFALTMNQNILRPYFWLSLSFYLSALNLLKREVNDVFSNRLPNA